MNTDEQEEKVKNSENRCLPGSYHPNCLNQSLRMAKRPPACVGALYGSLCRLLFCASFSGKGPSLYNIPHSKIP